MKHAIKWLKIGIENYQKEAERLKDMDDFAYQACLTQISEMEIELKLLENKI